MACCKNDIFSNLFRRLRGRWEDGLRSRPHDTAFTSHDMTLPKDFTLPRLPEQSIRVLQLEAGVGDQVLVGTFEVVHIDQAGEYEPISYVWAQAPSESRTNSVITVQQNAVRRAIPVSPNLYGALLRLRKPDTRRRLWVDQICIDQGSDERNEQVRMMNKIYKNATHVLAWLGLDHAKLAHSAFELIHRLDEALRYMQGRKLSMAYNEELEILIEKDRMALDSLTDLPWFKRGWIVQEIGTMAPATMLWGDEHIDWEILHRVCDNLNAFHHLRTKLKVRTSDIKYMYRRFVEPDPRSYHANRFNFIYELHRARSLLFTDEKDRIFAWLGHYSVQTPNKQLAGLEADYNRSTNDVYHDLAIRALSGTNDEATGSALIALAAVQHEALESRYAVDGSDSEITAGEYLPSWVPDWRTYQSFLLSEPINAHRAHGTTRAKLHFDSSRRILRIHGIWFDKLERCSKPFQAKAFHHGLIDDNSEPVIASLWHEECCQSDFKSDADYPTGEARLYALMQTLSNGCVQIAGRERIPYHEIPKIRWMGQHALYLKSHINDSNALSPEIQELAKSANAAHTVEEWSRAANGASKNRRFAITRLGYYVLAPRVAEPGDEIGVLLGGKTPFCLRRMGEQYLLVGECYVHGLMNGEAIRMRHEGSLREQVFEIT